MKALDDKQREFGERLDAIARRDRRKVLLPEADDTSFEARLRDYEARLDAQIVAHRQQTQRIIPAIEGAGPAWTRLQDYYRSLGLAKWGARGEEGPLFAKGPSRLLGDIFEKTAGLTDFSPETRAALLMYPGREGFEKMPGLIEQYNKLSGSTCIQRIGCKKS